MAIRLITKNYHDLFKNAPLTYLSAVAIGGTTTALTVQSIKEFAINQVLYIGHFADLDARL